MHVLITYDISNQHPEVKAALKAKGYFDRWTANNQTYYLPNTTLWKTGDDITTASVKKEFEATIAELNATTPVVKDKIRIQRLLAVPFTGWQAITGDEHTE